MTKQFSQKASTGGGEPKEKKIVNEQEQNKPVNTGDQPFEAEDPSLKQQENKENPGNSSSSSSTDEIINNDSDDILNKDPGIQPE